MDLEYFLIVFSFLTLPPSIAFIVYFFINKYFPKIIFSLKRFFTKINKPDLLFVILIILTISGFYFHIGYRYQYYCCSTSEDINIDPLKNFELCVVSVGLLSIGYFAKNTIYGRMLLCTELLLWLFFLFFIKGGYNIIYDSAVIIIRFLLLRHLFNSRLKLRFILLITYSVFIVKAFFYDDPLISLYDKYYSVETIKKNKALIQGTWSGNVEYNVYKTGSIRTVHHTKSKNKKTLIDIISEMDTVAYTYYDSTLAISDPVTLHVLVDNFKISYSKGKALNYYCDFSYQKSYSGNQQIKLIPQYLSNEEDVVYPGNDSTSQSFEFNQQDMYVTYGRSASGSFKFKAKDYDLVVILLNEDSLVLHSHYYGIDIKLQRKKGF